MGYYRILLWELRTRDGRDGISLVVDIRGERRCRLFWQSGGICMNNNRMSGLSRVTTSCPALERQVNVARCTWLEDIKTSRNFYFAVLEGSRCFRGVRVSAFKVQTVIRPWGQNCNSFFSCLADICGCFSGLAQNPVLSRHTAHLWRNFHDVLEAYSRLVPCSKSFESRISKNIHHRAPAAARIADFRWHGHCAALGRGTAEDIDSQRRGYSIICTELGAGWTGACDDHSSDRIFDLIHVCPSPCSCTLERQQSEHKVHCEMPPIYKVDPSLV